MNEKHLCAVCVNGEIIGGRCRARCEVAGSVTGCSEFARVKCSECRYYSRIIEQGVCWGVDCENPLFKEVNGNLRPMVEIVGPHCKKFYADLNSTEMSDE